MIKEIATRAVAPILALAVFFGLAAAAPLSARAEAMKVAGLFETPIEEPWVKQIHQALLKAQDEIGIEYTYSESVKAADFARVMREYAEQGYQLIMGDAFGAERIARRVARVHSEDDEVPGIEPRVYGRQVAECREQQPSGYDEGYGNGDLGRDEEAPQAKPM